MKKIVFLLIAAVIWVSACQKIKSIANINFKIPFSQSVSVPDVAGYPSGAVLPAGGLNLPFPPVTVATNTQQYFDQYHASSKNLIAADLNDADIMITAPPGQNFNFLDSIQIFVSSETVPEILIAYLFDVPKGVTKINLVVVPGQDLKRYVVKDSITMRLKAHVNALPFAGTELQTEGAFHVTANPL